MVRKKCSHCKTISRPNARRCWNCRRQFVKPKRKPKLARGSEARLIQELAHAGKMADAWVSKVKRAVTAMHEWNKRERRIAARRAVGPQPPRPPRPATPTRGIKVKGDL